MKNKGFTLIELVITIALFAVIGGVMSSILFVTLRGSSKSDALETVSRSGDVALTQIANHIRYSKTLIFPDVETCQMNPPTHEEKVTITSFSDNTESTILCKMDEPTDIMLNGESLVDKSSVKVAECYFICTQKSLVDPPSISVFFTLTHIADNGLVENTNSRTFQTTILLRNVVE